MHPIIAQVTQTNWGPTPVYTGPMIWSTIMAYWTTIAVTVTIGVPCTLWGVMWLFHKTKQTIK